MVGLTTTVWGQCVIESWHRQDIRSGDTLLTLRAERCEMASNLFIKSGEFNCPKSCFLVKSKGCFLHILIEVTCSHVKQSSFGN